ncbi:phosphotransferase [Candidatus Woesearchaeota archaeon]|nr:phosphotransferase [Candidatus Woesearchaeota archaeon]
MKGSTTWYAVIFSENMEQSKEEGMIRSVFKKDISSIKRIDSLTSSLFAVVLEDKKQYIIKFYKGEEAYLNETTAYDILHKSNKAKDIPLLPLLCSGNHAEQNISYAVFPKTTPISLFDILKDNSNLYLAQEAGKILSQLHSIELSQEEKKNIKSFGPEEKAVREFSLTADILEKKGIIKKENKEELLLLFKNVVRQNTSSSLVHGNLHQWQFLCDNNQIRALMDFEACLIGMPEIDIIKAELFLRIFSPGAVNHFLKGYGSLPYSYYNTRIPLVAYWLAMSTMEHIKTGKDEFSIFPRLLENFFK